MKKNMVVFLAIMTMVMAMIPMQLFGSGLSLESTRLYGSNRIETSLEVCNSGWDRADTVVVAPADQENLVDALAAAPLAGQEDAPILLTYKDRLDSKVKNRIISLGAKKVYVIGAIQDIVRNQITAIGGITVVALKGSTRWETVKAINNQLYSIEGTFVIGYNALPDALSVSSYAAANRYAIILADADGRIPSGQHTLGSMVYLIGGPGLVADIRDTATRIAGRDRFKTNFLVMENLYFSYNKVYLANGFDNHLVDSLVAAPLAAKYKAPIVLTDNNSIQYLNTIKEKMNTLSEVIALGGTGIVSNSVRDSLASGTSNSSGAITVTGIIPVSLNSFKVVFNSKVDKDTAETVSNYIVDGSSLDIGFDSAILQSDGRTVLVMVDQTGASDMAPFNQQDKVTIEVKKNVIYNEDKRNSASGYTKEIVFHDVTQPKLASVKAYGSKKLVVEFTEPVNVSSLASNINNFRINGSYLSNYGINPSASTAVKATFGTAFPISNMIELYFETPLSTGNHSFTVKDGISGLSGWLVDGANFAIQESSMNFRVESYSGAPSIQSVNVVNSKIQVKFNRSMYKYAYDPNNGRGSALNTSYYDINDTGESSSLARSPLSSYPVFKSGSEDTIVEFNVDSGVIKNGVNILEVDKDVEDAWGNKLHDTSNVRISFTYRADIVKPYVLSVACLSDTKVRIHFSEAINKDFAQNISNYSIKDSDGVELLGKNAGGTANCVPLNQDSDTVELIMPSKTYLNQSNYVLKIENLRDTAFDANYLDTYTTTFNGYDDRGPELMEVIADVNDDTKAVCFFNEAVSADSIRTSNFGYKDGEGYSRNLPSGTSVSQDGTGKIVTVDFPSAYTVKVQNGGAGDTNGKYEVNGIRASNIKDKAGNIMPGIAMTVNVQANASGDYRPHYIKDSFNLYDDGDYVRAEVKLSQYVSNLRSDDFRIGAKGVGFAGGIAPNTAYTVGEKIVLRYTDDDKVSLIRALGPEAYIYSKSQNNIGTEGISGVKILEFAVAGYQVYDEQIKPRILINDPVIPTLKISFSGENALVVIAFTEEVDDTVTGLYKDDFTFECGGSLLTVQGVSVDPLNRNLLRYNVGPAAELTGSTIHVRAIENRNSVRDLSDRGPEDQNIYVPTRADKDGRSISDSIAPAISTVEADSGTNKVKVTFSETIFAPGSASDFKLNSPYDEGRTTAAAATGWTWSGDNASVTLTFGAIDLKAKNTYSLIFTSPASSRYKDLGAHYLASVTKQGFVNTSVEDLTAPLVMIPIGDQQDDDEIIASGASVYIRFSEVLSSTGKSAVTTALNAANKGTGSFTYTWDDTTAKLIATATGGSVIFKDDVTCNITDGKNSSVGVTIVDK